MLKLFADTDMDFSTEVAGKYGYKLISMPYAVDGKEVFPYVDFERFESHIFYDSLRNGTLPTTSAISEQNYIDYFEPEFAAGNDILYVHFSSAMSMTFNGMNAAVAKLKEKYPERKFYEVDTKGITIVSYLIACEISDMIKAGKTVEEVLKWSETEVDHFAQYFFADGLKFFHRSGRVSGLAATMGGLIGLRPVIHMSQDGKMESIGTVKGRVQVMERLVQYVLEMGDDVVSHRVIVGHTDAPELAEQLAAMLQEKFGGKLDIEIVVTNPTAGSHCGPDGVGVAFHSKGR